VTMTGMAIWVAVAVFMPVGVVGLAQDFNLSRAIAVEHVRRLAVSAQPRAVERVDAAARRAPVRGAVLR